MDDDDDGLMDRGDQGSMHITSPPSDPEKCLHQDLVVQERKLSRADKQLDHLSTQFMTMQAERREAEVALEEVGR